MNDRSHQLFENLSQNDDGDHRSPAADSSEKKIEKSIFPSGGPALDAGSRAGDSVFAQRWWKRRFPHLPGGRIIDPENPISSQSDGFAAGSAQTRQLSGGAKLPAAASPKYPYFCFYRSRALAGADPTANQGHSPELQLFLEIIDFSFYAGEHNQPRHQGKLLFLREFQYASRAPGNDLPFVKIDEEHLNTSGISSYCPWSR